MSRIILDIRRFPFPQERGFKLIQVAYCDRWPYDFLKIKGLHCMKFFFISVPYMINIQGAKSALKVIDIFIFVSQVSPWAFKTWINM